MPRNEGGEYELVVGNKQLLSVIFVLFVLFGVVFSMGYIVGQNSTPEPDIAGAAAAGRPRPKPTPAQPAQAPPETAAEPPLAPGDARVTADPPPAGETATPPPAEAQRAAARPPEPPRTAEPEKPSPVEAGPLPGQTYLQVTAVKRPDAELLVDVLKKKGFHALTAPVIVNGQVSGEIYRALVGPLRDAGEVAKTKADLETLGWNPIVRKY